MADRTCTIEGCNRRCYARGLCQGHYTRQRRGLPLTGDFRARRSSGQCSVSECVRPVKSRGMCDTHYQRSRLGIALHLPMQVSNVGPCAAPECDRPAKAAGLCVGHYARRRKGRSSDAPVKATRAKGCGSINQQGYHVTSIDGRRVLTHRLVMERVLGRPLEPHENVHHLNGRKDDNRPENLQIWITPQPKGQRPEDLAQWVVEHYPHLVADALAAHEEVSGHR